MHQALDSSQVYPEKRQQSTMVDIEPEELSSRITRIKAGKPAYAWDDPDIEYNHGKHQCLCDGAEFSNNNDAQNGIREQHSHHKPHRLPSFYDREAINEKLQELRSEKVRLAAVEVAVKDRINRAEAALAVLRTEKRELSTAKMLGEAVVAGQHGLGSRGSGSGAVATVGGRGFPKYSSRGDRADESGGDGGEGHVRRRQDAANFEAKDRIMELELLNDQLRKGQAAAESEATSTVDAARLAKQERCRAEQRLHSLPKRFTESLEMLREEVEELEKEKLALKLARQSKHLQENDFLSEIHRQKKNLSAEMESLLDEIDQLENDRDLWKRQLRVESSRTTSLQAQRKDALALLQSRFGDDAVERAAFATAAFIDRDDDESRGLRDVGGGGNGGSIRIPISTIGNALRSVYKPDDDVVLSEEAVLEAAKECVIKDGVRGSGGPQIGGSIEDVFVGIEEFCAVAKCLLRRKRRREDDHGNSMR